MLIAFSVPNIDAYEGDKQLKIKVPGNREKTVFVREINRKNNEVIISTKDQEIIDLLTKPADSLVSIGYSFKGDDK